VGAGAWTNAGLPRAEAAAKVELLRWRLHALLAKLTGDGIHAHEAVLCRPDLPTTRAALGATLLRANRPREAVSHLRQALDTNPFDGPTAALLHRALLACGDTEGAARLAEKRRLLWWAAPHAVKGEPWFVGQVPAADALASVIVLCHNEVEYTRLCLESVLARTRSPYELILIDNGSSDGTADYLVEVASRPGTARVEVITNESNRGYHAAVNQGLARAGGEYVVLLNNDTVVTSGWLEGLVAWARHDWPSVGLVGAVTNFAPSPQQVEPGYTDLGGLPDFAVQRRRQFASKSVRVHRLSGFCLLARKDVLQRVGGLDEQFRIGFFDDDDLGLRVREAGFQLLLALDVYQPVEK
jgi:Glycosyl transferase family 2